MASIWDLGRKFARGMRGPRSPFHIDNRIKFSNAASGFDRSRMRNPRNFVHENVRNPDGSFPMPPGPARPKPQPAQRVSNARPINSSAGPRAGRKTQARAKGTPSKGPRTPRMATTRKPQPQQQYGPIGPQYGPFGPKPPRDPRMAARHGKRTAEWIKNNKKGLAVGGAVGIGAMGMARGRSGRSTSQGGYNQAQGIYGY